MSHCLYAHGFEGRPSGPKSQFLKNAFGWTVKAPSLHSKGWTLSGHADVITDALDAQPAISWLVASSFGAFAAIRALSQRRSRPLNVILLAPALNFAEVLSERLGSDGMAEWKQSQVLPYEHAGVGECVDLPYSLWTECHDYRDLAVHHRCVIIHGLRDVVIPIAVSRALKTRSPGVIELLEVDDGHTLNDSYNFIREAVQRLVDHGASTR